MDDGPTYKRGDAIWCLFGPPFSGWFSRDRDEAVPAIVLDAYANGFLVVEYEETPYPRDGVWFTARETRRRILPRSVESIPPRPVPNVPNDARRTT